MRKAFLIIEVLVSIFIISLIILNISLIYKNLVKIKDKTFFYQKYYITVKSLINLLESDNLLTFNGTMNGFKYKVIFIPVEQKRNFIVDYDNNIVGNLGKREYILYKVIINLKKSNFNKKIVLFITRMKKK